MNKVKNIAKNTSYLTLALIIQKIISFSYFILLSRYLGMEVLGQYYTAVAFTTILALVVDLGFANILIREVAKDKQKTETWMRPILGLKLILSIVAAGLAFIFAKIAGYESFILVLILISFIAMLFDSFTNTFFSVIRGFHNLKYESLSAIFFQVIILILGLSFMRLGFNAYYLMATMALASLVNLIFSSLVSVFKYKLNILPQINLSVSKTIILISWPFAVYNILQRVYSYLDSLLLGFLANYVQVGIYQIAFKIVFALQFLPLAFIASLYPAMSHYWKNNKDQLEISYKRAINYLIIISVPIIFGVFVLAYEIVNLMGADNEAVWPLRIIMFSLFFIFLNFPVGSLLNACDKQKTNTFNMGIVTLVSISLNLLLIPLLAALGASITVFLTNALLFTLNMRASYLLLNYRFNNSWPILYKTFIAALFMALFVFLFDDFIHLYINVFIAALVYFSLLYVLKGIQKNDIISIIESFTKKKIKA